VPVEILPQRRHSVFAGPFFVAEMLLRRRDLLEVATKYRARVVQTYGLGTLDFLVGTLRIGRKLDVWWTIENVAFMVRAEHLGRHRWLLRPKRSAHRVLYRVGARFVSGVIAVSDETERSFRESVGYEGRNVAVVLNSVDLVRFPADIDRPRVRAQLGFRADDHVMTMVGTFKRQKGHRHLVEALAQLAGEHPELHLLFVGDGELMPVIDAQVRDAGLTERVHFLGSRRDVDAILAASDTFVLPSLWEGLSVALVEAMASGLPIVATDVSGTNEVMVDDSTGRLVPPGDAEALAAAIRDVLADPVLAADMGARARAHVMEICGARRQAERLAALFGRGSVESDAPDGLPLAAAAAR
jgi:glycosyltransferase involved in cell wall biosynthesis